MATFTTTSNERVLTSSLNITSSLSYDAPERWNSESAIFTTPAPPIELNILGVSPTTVWDDGQMVESVEVEFKITSSEQFMAPFTIELAEILEDEVPVNQVVKRVIPGGDGTLKLTVGEVEFTYTIIKEDKDTLIAVRRFKYDKSHERQGVYLEPGVGYTGEGYAIMKLHTKRRFGIVSNTVTSTGESVEVQNVTKEMEEV